MEENNNEYSSFRFFIRFFTFEREREREKRGKERGQLPGKFHEETNLIPPRFTVFLSNNPLFWKQQRAQGWHGGKFKGPYSTEFSPSRRVEGSWRSIITGASVTGGTTVSVSRVLCDRSNSDPYPFVKLIKDILQSSSRWMDRQSSENLSK